MPERTENEARPASRPPWRSWLQLGILGAMLTFAGLTVGNGGLPQVELYPKAEGISRADSRHLDEIKKLGGEAHFMERTPRFLGVFGGRDLLYYGFRGTAFDDDNDATGKRFDNENLLTVFADLLRQRCVNTGTDHHARASSVSWKGP
jgi:hypothetical protein